MGNDQTLEQQAINQRNSNTTSRLNPYSK